MRIYSLNLNSPTYTYYTYIILPENVMGKTTRLMYVSKTIAIIFVEAEFTVVHRLVSTKHHFGWNLNAQFLRVICTIVNIHIYII